jgi:hypothetical protein
MVAYLQQQVDILHAPLALQDTLQDLHHPACALTAGCAFAARFMGVELGGTPREMHDTGMLIQHDTAARADHAAFLHQLLIADEGIHTLFGRQDGHRGAAGDDALELAPCHPACHLDEFHQGCAELHLVVAGAVHMPADREDFGAAAVFGAGAQLGIPLPAVQDDVRYAGERLAVVDEGGAVPHACDSGQGCVGEFEARHAALAHQAGHHRRFLATFIGACAHVDVEIVIEAAAQNVFAQIARAVCLIDGFAHLASALHIFAPNVDIAAACPHRVARDNYPLDELVWRTIHQLEVFEGAGFALVGVAQHIVRLLVVFRDAVPFNPCGEACAAAPTQPRFLNLVDDRLTLHLQRLAQRLIAAVRFVHRYLIIVRNVPTFQQQSHFSHRSSP